MLYPSLEKFLWLDQIQPRHRSQVGEKAFYLSQLKQRGYPVVPGFAIPTPALREFLETIHWIDPLFADLPNSSLHLDVDNARQLQLVAKAIRQEIIEAVLPVKWESILTSIANQLEAPTLILRPSLAMPSTNSWKMVGLLEAQTCAREPNAIAAGIKRTWAELFRARSLLYWRRKGIQLDEINLAILVQPIYNSLASGLLVAKSPNWEIQASYGLEMAILRGEVQPDCYQVQPETGTVASQQLGVKTLAYNVTDLSIATLPIGKNGDDLPIKTFMVSESHQKEFALPEEYLKQLIHLQQKLAAELNSHLTLEWTLTVTGAENSTSQLQITQVHSEQEVGRMGVTEQGNRERENIHPPLPSRSSAPLLRGLAASTGRAIGLALKISEFDPNLATMAAGKILVLKTLHPDWLPLLKRSVAVVAEQGGMTCHAAIIARELGIPAVVGVRDATQILQAGDSLLVDGDRGEIYVMENEAIALSEGTRNNRKSEMEEELQELEEQKNISGSDSIPITAIEEPKAKYLPATNFPVPIATELMVNLSQPMTIERAAKLPVDGIGLLRSELMLLEVLEGQHPSRWLSVGRKQELIELIAHAISQFTSAFAPRPVFYRSLDWRSHEFQSLTPLFVNEVNPMLGMRGTFSYLQDPTLFDIELAALYRVYQSGYKNIRLLLPFVRTVQEFSFCRHRVEKFGFFYEPHFQLWIVAEVPSVLFLVADYVKAGVQGISIGTNDLTQLLLGVDRDRAEMANSFDEQNPAVKKAIYQLIRDAKAAGIPCSICGQAPVQHPELIDDLVRWGISSISVSLDAVDRTYARIARAEQRLLLDAARQRTS